VIETIPYETATFEVTLSGNVDDLDLGAIKAQLEATLCAGVAGCTVTVKVQGGSTVLEVQATAPAAAEQGSAGVAEAATAFVDSPPAEIGGSAVEDLTAPRVAIVNVDVAVAPPPPSPPPPATLPPTQDDSDSDGSSLYIIIGAAGGGALVLLLAAVAVACACRRRRRRAPLSQSVKMYVEHKDKKSGGGALSPPKGPPKGSSSGNSFSLVAKQPPMITANSYI